MLSFHHSVLNEINSEPTGGLLMMSRGHFIHEFLSFYISNILRSPSVVAIFLNFPKEEAEYIVSNLSAWGKTRCKIIESEATKKRSKIYCQGGVFFLTTRVFVIDILQLAVTPSMITHVMFYRADMSKTIYSRDVWAATMIKSENKDACIIGLCESLDKVAIEKSLTRLMRLFYMKKAFFWPTCRFEVQRELNSVNDIEQNECLLPLSNPQKNIQTVLMKIILSTSNEINRKNKIVLYEKDELFSRSKRYLQVKAEKLFRTLPDLKKESMIEDIQSLRSLLSELLTHDPIAFYKKLLSTQRDASEESVWYVNDSKTGNRIYQLKELSKERMYQLVQRTSPIEMSLRDFCETLKVRTGESGPEKFRFLKESYSDDTLLLTKFKVSRDLHLNIEQNSKLEQLKTILEDLGKEYDPKFPEQMKTLWVYASTEKQVEQIMSFLKNTFYKRDKNLFSTYNKLRNFLYWEQPTRMKLLKEYVKKKHTELSQAMEEENFEVEKDKGIDNPNFFVSDYSQEQMYQMRVEEAFLCECLYICLEVWLSTYKDVEKFLLNRQLETEIAGTRGPLDFNPTFTRKRGGIVETNKNLQNHNNERHANEIIHNIDYNISLANPDDYDYSGNAVFPATRMIPGYKIVVNCLRVTTARHKFLFNENPHAIILYNPDPEILREALLFKASERSKIKSNPSSTNNRLANNLEEENDELENDELVEKHIEVMIRESEKMIEQRLPAIDHEAMVGLLSTNYPTFKRKHVEVFIPENQQITSTSATTYMGHGLEEASLNGKLPYYEAFQHYAKEDKNLLLDEAEREFLKKLESKVLPKEIMTAEEFETEKNKMDLEEESSRIQSSFSASTDLLNHLESMKIPLKERNAALSSCNPIHHPSFKTQLQRDHSLNPRVEEVNLMKLFAFMYKNSLESAVYMTHQKQESQSFEALLKEHDEISQEVENPLCRVQNLVSENCNKEGEGPGRFIPPLILVDKREFNSNLPSRIYHEGFRAFPILLYSGDFIVSNEVVIERKAVDTGDLIDSIKSGRLDKQLQRMEENFKKSYLLIDFNGDENLEHESEFKNRTFFTENEETMKMNVIFYLATLIVRFPKTSILWSKNHETTIKIFKMLKKGENEPEVRPFLFREKKKDEIDEEKEEKEVMEELEKSDSRFSYDDENQFS